MGRILAPRNRLLVPRGFSRPQGQSLILDPLHHLSQGIIGYWPLGDAANGLFQDIGPHGCHAAGNNGPLTFGLGNRGGQSNRFTAASTQYLTTTRNLGMVQGQFSEYTIIASGYKVSSADGSIVTQFDGAKAPFYFRIGATSNSGMTVGGSFATINTPNPSLNTWHQFALTYCREGGIGLSYYLDGVFQASNGTVGGAPDVNAASNFRIGSINTIGQYWDGYLENIRIYNRCLNAGEIKALYVEPWAGVYPIGANLVGSTSTAYTLIAAQGSFTLSGQAAALKLAGKLPAAYGAYALTGDAAYPRLDSTFGNLMPGMYALTGQDAELERATHWTDIDCTDSPWSHDECDCH